MIPQILESRGILSGLYTDSTYDSLLGRVAYFLCRFIKNSPSLLRLTRRKTGIAKSKVFANDQLQIRLLFNRLLKRPLLSDVETVFEGSSRQFIRQGLKDADWLYVMFIENFDFTLYAKRNGLKVVTDIYENPYIWKDLEDEIEKEAYTSIRHLKDLYTAQATLRQRYIDSLLLTADKYLVPSVYVKNCLKKSPNYSESKVNIIPYVSSVRNKIYSNNPIKGRIIWIGNDVVRKGLCYCAEAAAKIKEAGYEIDFRIIGPIPDELTTDPFYQHLNFIGYCNKEQLEEEFRLADMFVFPTLAEGFAGVLLEASSFGVPIITTDASGFAEDAPCLFIEKKDSHAIVTSVISLLDNREHRDSLSKKIFDYSQTFGNSSFENGLIALLNNE